MMPKRLYFIASFYFLILSFAVSVNIYSSIKQEKPFNASGLASKDNIIVTTTLKSNQKYFESAPLQKITAIGSRGDSFSITPVKCEETINKVRVITQGSIESKEITNCARRETFKLSIETNSGLLSCSIHNNIQYNHSTPNSVAFNSNIKDGIKFQSTPDQIMSPIKAPTLGNYLFLASK